ncbi:hypothetical protein BAUCODRAFT_520026 [Baudoinia panamericana UAMH 10762]|uniref:Uncharacterized protein n=1 Tax=Baudoinia panamericana (strain UAMH 10762) TaxID=717646 RepID=M2N7B0_BAUPA|nr:uncharacterized protein BAUCODRAFT_520026 [Baudoinia panamericana UAMH 10762]EMC94959.1 hypothetical protein BAUCODRAFT_520026 [Baudoinia panamericana UAMH 10762]
MRVVAATPIRSLDHAKAKCVASGVHALPIAPRPQVLAAAPSNNSMSCASASDWKRTSYSRRSHTAKLLAMHYTTMRHSSFAQAIPGEQRKPGMLPGWRVQFTALISYNGRDVKRLDRAQVKARLRNVWPLDRSNDGTLRYHEANVNCEA